MPALSGPLRLSPQVTFLPQEDRLHVITGRGTFTLRATGIATVHARVHPHLTGAYSRDDLLAATPEAHRPAVGSYLTHLSTAGALHSDAPPPKDTLRLPGLHIVRDLPRTAAISFRTTPPDALRHVLAHPSIDVVTAGPASFVGSLLVETVPGTVRGRWVLLECAPGAAPIKPEAPVPRRVLDLLLRRPAPAGQIEVARLDPQGPVVTRRGAVPADALERLPSALGLIQPTTYDQTILPSAEIDHPLFPGPIRIAALRHTDLAPALLDLLAAACASEVLGSPSRCIGPTPTTVRDSLRAADAARTNAPPAPSPGSGGVDALNTPEGQWCRAELAAAEALPDVAVRTTPDGITICRSAHYCHAARSHEAAMIGVLLYHLRDLAGLPPHVALCGVTTAHPLPGISPPDPASSLNDPPNVTPVALWGRKAAVCGAVMHSA